MGVGLKLLDLPEVKVMSMSPELLEKMNLAIQDSSLVVPVAHRIPARIMGSGIGSNTSDKGDYDVQLFDKDTVAEYGLEDLRFGDIVAIMDADNSFGPIYRKGAITIGIIAHSDCITAGHGPGVTRLFTSRTGKIIPQIGTRRSDSEKPRCPAWGRGWAADARRRAGLPRQPHAPRLRVEDVLRQGQKVPGGKVNEPSEILSTAKGDRDRPKIRTQLAEQ